MTESGYEIANAPPSTCRLKSRPASVSSSASRTWTASLEVAAMVFTFERPIGPKRSFERLPVAGSVGGRSKIAAWVHRLRSSLVVPELQKRKLLRTSDKSRPRAVAADMPVEIIARGVDPEFEDDRICQRLSTSLRPYGCSILARENSASKPPGRRFFERRVGGLLHLWSELVILAVTYSEQNHASRDKCKDSGGWMWQGKPRPSFFRHGTIFKRLSLL